MADTALTHWEHTARDVVPDLVPGGAPRDVGAELLVALLDSEGAAWSPPYEDIRRRLGIRKKKLSQEEQAPGDSRIRTYMALYRSLGLTYDKDGELAVTTAGQDLRQIVDRYYTQVDAFGLAVTPSLRRAVARVMLPVLARVQLQSPISQTYPDGTDIHPLRALWAVARRCDNRLHWEEISRCVTSCLREDQLEDAIATIQQARTARDYDPKDPASCELHLGPRQPDLGDSREQKDRLTIPWLSKAAFKNIVFELNDREDDYRHLVEDTLPLLDAALARPVEFHDFDNVGAYMEWLGSAQPMEGGVAQETEWDSLRGMVLDRVARYGHNRVITLVGPAGTGKSTLAREVMKLLSDGDPTRELSLQFHAAYNYDDVMGGVSFDRTGRPVPGPGLMVRFFADAAGRPNERHVVLMDELSRADVANVFGELLTYIEHRNEAFSIPTLPGSRIYVPENVTFLATMNPRDRSVINLDDALLRRLRQVDIPSSTTALEAILQKNGMRAELQERVAAWFDQLPPDAPFGHGLFVEVVDEEDLYTVWHDVISRYLYRGGVATYRDPQAIEAHYVWKVREERPLSAVAEPSGEYEATSDSSDATAEAPDE